MNKAWLMSGFAILAALVISLAGCSSGVDDAPAVDGLLGSHPAEWVKNHWSDFLNKASQCETCHGSVTDKALAGGISKVSCFACHHPNGVSHASGFEVASEHGRNAAQRAPSRDTETLSMLGFASCKKCHGDDYKGVGAALSCFTCHNKAPHPDAPWTGRTITVVSHTMTAAGNMSACAQCHTGGNNSTVKPTTQPPAGTPAGCFNSTLCHTRNA